MSVNVSNKDNRAGVDTVPPLPKVNSLQAIMRLRPKKEDSWGVFAFVLNRDMIKPDGTLDELHAMVFSLGSRPNQAEAEKHATNVIAITGHPGVVAAQYGSPFPLTTKFDPKHVQEVALDSKGRVIEMESAQYKRDREDYEKRAKHERDIMKEAEEETDPENIEHFKRQCYLAIKNRASFQVHTREADTAWQNYKKREANVRDHFARHPEHEAQWLPYLKAKLIERGEAALYHGLETAYKELRDELLGLIDSDSDDNEPSCEPLNVSRDDVNNPESTANNPESTVNNPMSTVNNPESTVNNPMSTINNPKSTANNSESTANNPKAIEDKLGKIATKSPLNLLENESFSEISSSSSDDCSGGICMASNVPVPIAVPPMTPNGKSVECSGGVCRIKKRKSDSDDDIMISADDVANDSTTPVAPENLDPIVESSSDSDEIIEHPIKSVRR